MDVASFFEGFDGGDILKDVSKCQNCTNNEGIRDLGGGFGHDMPY